MKGLLLKAGLGLAIATASTAFADDVSIFDKAKEFQVAAADQAQVDSYLKDTRDAASLSVPELRARMRTGRSLIEAGGIEPAALRQIRTKVREARDELAKRGTGQGQSAGAAEQPAAGQTTEANQQARQQTAQAAPAAQSSPEVAAFLAEKPDLKSLSPAALRDRARKGRSLVQAGQITRADRRAVLEAVRAAQTELRSRRSQQQAQGTAQPKPAEGQTAQNQQQPAQAPAAQSSPEVQTYLSAAPDLKSLDQAALRNRIRTGRALISQGKASRRDRRAVAEAVRAAQAELRARGSQQTGQTQPNTGANTLKPANDQAAEFLAQSVDLKSANEAVLRRRVRAGNQVLALQGLSDANKQAVTRAVRSAQNELQSRNAGTQPDQNQQGSTGNQQNSAEATALLNDSRNSQALSDRELNQRLRQLRTVLTQRNLPAATQRTLRQKLAADRAEIRRRVAVKGRPQQGTGQNQQQGRPVDRPAGFYLTDRRPPRDLEPWDLRQRISRLTIIINDNSTPRARRDEYARLIANDRAELRRRYLANRDERRTYWRDRRDKGELNIGININLGDPPPLVRGYPEPVYVAEADDEEIERQFIAPPVRKPARRYTIEEVVNDEEVRRTMPAVELDSVKFGFNEDFIREEALDDMDKVGDAMEKILAAHPEEIFLIEGHTDAVGSDGYNLDLSKRRAAAVMEALTTYYNIQPENLKTVGYGERYLKIPTQEEEPENRRATIRRVTPLVGEAS
jgi:outer membrane protein OmpA-like peptidoglycan-associated protein